MTELDLAAFDEFVSLGGRLSAEQGEELIAEVRRLRESDDEGDQLRSRMSDLLSRTAVALNGPEPELTMWSWHDLPEKSQAAMDAIARVRALHTSRPCPCGPEPHDPKRAGNGEVWCYGPTCRQGETLHYPCATIRALDGE